MHERPTSIFMVSLHQSYVAKLATPGSPVSCATDSAMEPISGATLNQYPKFMYVVHITNSPICLGNLLINKAHSG